MSGSKKVFRPKTLPLLTPPLCNCTVGWFAKTELCVVANQSICTVQINRRNFWTDDAVLKLQRSRGREEIVYQQRSPFSFLHFLKAFGNTFAFVSDGVSSVDNRPSTNYHNHFVKKKYTWHMTPDTWHLTLDTWHGTPDMGHLTHGGVNILSKFQISSSHGLAVMILWRFGGKVLSDLSDLISNRGVCRTALATPGLLIRVEWSRHTVWSLTFCRSVCKFAK